MRWYAYVAYFLGGAFFANFIPHFVAGISGRAFPTPFASPPGEGESAAFTNVLWAAFNLVIAYLLIIKVGTFDIRQWRHAVVAGAGGLVMAVILARGFGQIYGGA